MRVHPPTPEKSSTLIQAYNSLIRSATDKKKWGEQCGLYYWGITTSANCLLLILEVSWHRGIFTVHCLVLCHWGSFSLTYIHVRAHWLNEGPSWQSFDKLQGHSLSSAIECNVLLKYNEHAESQTSLPSSALSCHLLPLPHIVAADSVILCTDASCGLCFHPRRRIIFLKTGVSGLIFPPPPDWRWYFDEPDRYSPMGFTNIFCVQRSKNRFETCFTNWFWLCAQELRR